MARLNGEGDGGAKGAPRRGTAAKATAAKKRGTAVERPGPRNADAGARGSAVKAAPTRPARRVAAKKTRRAAAEKVRRAGAKPAVPARTIRIQALDPQRKCGAATSVLHLFRVDEQVSGVATTHLVFFDRHGWYCQHGRNCPAVADVRRLNDVRRIERQLDRTIKVG